MTKKEQSESADQKFIEEEKIKKSDVILNAFLIGFLIGIVIYSIAANSWGIFTIIPLFLAYKLIKNSRNNKGSKTEER